MPTPHNNHSHHNPPKNLDLQKALRQEQIDMEKVDVPIVTVSGTFKKELAERFNTLPKQIGDVLYSRAHYSMAEAVRQQALAEKHTTHLIDPMNYVDYEGWKKVTFTQTVGRAMARSKILRWIKDLIDTKARSKLPIREAITAPLLYLTEYIKKPIISMHYEAGNILAENRFSVLQYITDPHVRPQYLDPLPPLTTQENTHIFGHMTYAVFDQHTKEMAIKLASELGKKISEDQIVVTGPPVDPRICEIAKDKQPPKNGEAYHLAITTGGTGTNLEEIRTLLYRLVPLLQPPEKIKLFLYAGIHKDFRDLFENFSAEHAIRVGNIDDESARIRILFEDSVIDANENLVRYMFPWAHGIITKPSGDMAYDAAAAGCFLLFLEPLGPWEENIQKIFVKNDVGFDFHIETALSHFNSLESRGLLAEAMENAKNLDPLYRSGVKNLLKLHKSLCA